MKGHEKDVSWSSTRIAWLTWSWHEVDMFFVVISPGNAELVALSSSVRSSYRSTRGPRSMALQCICLDAWGKGSKRQCKLNAYKNGESMHKQSFPPNEWNVWHVSSKDIVLLSTVLLCAEDCLLVACFMYGHKLLSPRTVDSKHLFRAGLIGFLQ